MVARSNRLLHIHILILILWDDEGEGDSGGAMSLRKTLLAVLVFAGTGRWKKRSVRFASLAVTTRRPGCVLFADGFRWVVG